MQVKRNNTVILVECALLMALSIVLSMIKVWEMPQGGAVTAAGMVPVAMIALRHGTKWGLGAGFAYSLVQMLIGFVPPPRQNCRRIGKLWKSPSGDRNVSCGNLPLRNRFCKKRGGRGVSPGEAGGRCVKERKLLRTL